MLRVLVLSCSLNRTSRSAVLARAAMANLEGKEVETMYLDLRDLDLPLSDGEGDGGARGTAGSRRLTAAVAAADAVLMAVPIYNYDVSAATKLTLELAGGAWNDKPVGFLCAAGGRASYMSVLPLANSLMLDFRCLILPRFVYATGDDFDGDAPGPLLNARVAQLCEALVRLTAAVQAALVDPPLVR